MGAVQKLNSVKSHACYDKRKKAVGYCFLNVTNHKLQRTCTDNFNISYECKTNKKQIIKSCMPHAWVSGSLFVKESIVFFFSYKISMEVRVASSAMHDRPRKVSSSNKHAYSSCSLHPRLPLKATDTDRCTYIAVLFGLSMALGSNSFPRASLQL